MKTCPVCRARAFEDAEVCYGCLHRFDGDGRDSAVAEETAWEPADAVQRAASAPPSAQAQLQVPSNVQMQSRVPVSARAQSHVPAVPRTRPAMPSGAAPAAGDPSAADVVPFAGDSACSAGEPPARLPSASRPSAAGSACGTGGPLVPGDAKRSEGAALHARPAFGLPAQPFDRAGWIVRFELPGGVAHASAAPGEGALPAETCGTLPLGGEAGSGPLSLVVSICPLLEGEGAAAVPAPRDAPMAGGRLLGGDVPADDPASAALAGRRGRHAGLPLAAAAEGARP